MIEVSNTLSLAHQHICSLYEIVRNINCYLFIVLFKIHVNFIMLCSVLLLALSIVNIYIFTKNVRIMFSARDPPCRKSSFVNNYNASKRNSERSTSCWKHNIVLIEVLFMYVWTDIFVCKYPTAQRLCRYSALVSK